MNWLAHIRQHLPLTIEVVEWNDPVLLMRGPNWNLSCQGAWRTSKDGRVSVACYDRNAPTVEGQLMGDQVIDVRQQSEHVRCDPVFVLRSGRTLEFFSASIIDPWVMHLPSDPIIVAAPSAPASME